MRRGADFLARKFEPGRHPLHTYGEGLPYGEGLRCRVAGNGLRELDRFLNLLIDETAIACGQPATPRIHNTASKLSSFAVASGLPDLHRKRLLALGRSRACLFYGWGMVSRADRPGGTHLTAGWWDPLAPHAEPRLRRVPLGERLHVSDAELVEVSAYYRALADMLAAHAAGLAEPARQMAAR